MMKKFLLKTGLITQDESGATAIEYGLLAALIAVVIIGAVRILGNTLAGIFTNINGQIN